MGATAAAIAGGLEAEIRAGRLAPGSRLPTHRDLAHRHSVSLNTATQAMRLLAERGLIVGEVGRGSFVRAPGHVDGASFRIEAASPDTIDMARNVMLLPGLADRYEAAIGKVLRRDRTALLDYQPHAGRSIDRAAGALWLSRRGHLANDPSRVLVCAGAQHATTVALMAVTRPGDTVAVEALTWPGIKASAAALRLNLLPVPLDRDGLRVRALLRLATRTRIAALYCMPTLQNPTGAVLPSARREALAALARRLDFQIIEDDPYGFLVPDGPPPVAALAPERTWHVHSTSKLLAPGLRTAWLMAPPGQEGRAADAIRATVWTSPPLGAAVASLWVGDGTAADLEEAKQDEARIRQAMTARALGREAPLARHETAMHAWLELPGRLRAQDFVRLAADRGVSVSPAAAFGVGRAPNAVRLALGAPPSRERLTEGLQRLATLL